jgi:hypothetical protein
MTRIGARAKAVPMRYIDGASMIRPNAEAIGGTSATTSTIAMEMIAETFIFLFVKGPILNRE